MIRVVVRYAVCVASIAIVFYIPSALEALIY